MVTLVMVSKQLYNPKLSSAFNSSVDSDIKDIAKTLSRKVTTDNLKAHYSETAEVLKLVGAGAFLAAMMVMPNLPLIVKPLLKKKYQEEKDSWKRFNIPYLKRTIDRLEKQKLVTITELDGEQVVKITNEGRQRILRFALDELVIKKPRSWDGTWYMVSYDIPNQFSSVRHVLHEYLSIWGFYPLHKSDFLHAYPCEKELAFLREYLGVSKYVRIFKVSKIENDQSFREFFGV